MFEFFVYLVTVAITPGPNTISSMANAAEKGFKGVTAHMNRNRVVLDIVSL